ncbi:hemolysin family protein [Bdellovibrio sp. SKB1291214]|uniref:CNNM domain-containing protein n=1 Tax=Bdellovibrio sp. SKB1291214 TaxID=1732569 RepID=UPI000B51B4FB|nr:hemolysin family protein [Bdellovibrio sp. SKB1291214]UYL09818.1 hemolysin family protein [Bdellovibrio sp. SKB1291214]
MSLLVLLVISTLTISFVCSMLEATLLTSTSAYIAVLVRENRRSAKLLEHLKENLDRPISAILTLNTLSHTLGSAAIAYQVQAQYGEQAVTIASFILTFAILVLSEIIPKSIGAAHWKALIPFTAYTIQLMIICLYPLVIMSEWLGRLFQRRTEEPEVTREEILMTAEMGAEEGSLKGKESNIIKNLLMLDKIYVSDIMTPRSVFFALEKDLTVEEVFNKYKPLRFSRIPVYHGSLDNIVGMTYRYKIHEALSNDQHEKVVGELVTPISSIPERMTASQVLDYFIKEKEHIALAVDEYGIVAGLVSLEDAVETLLGVEIVDELDSVEDMRKFALEQWQLRKQKLRKS